MPNTHETLESLFVDTANAIRAKTGGTAEIVADEFPQAIALIPSGGGASIQSGVFTPASQAATHTIVVDDDIAAHPFVCIFSVDAEQTPVNLSLVQAAYFVADPTVNITPNANQWVLASSSTKFMNGITSGMSGGQWKSTTKQLILSARGSANFYAGAQYSYVILPLTGLTKVWRY